METRNIILEKTKDYGWIIAPNSLYQVYRTPNSEFHESDIYDEIANGANIMVFNIAVSDKHLNDMSDYVELVDTSDLTGGFDIHNYVGKTKHISFGVENFDTLIHICKSISDCTPKYIYVKKVL